MNPELQNAIAELVKTLTGGAKGAGNALQSVAPEAWRIAIRQVQIDAIATVLIWSLAGIVFLSFAQFAVSPFIKRNKAELKIAQVRVAEARENAIKNSPEYNPDSNKDVQDAKKDMNSHDETVFGLRILYWALTLVGLLFICGSIASRATDLLNPEYKAGVSVIQITRGHY
jgi:hypothetical protein